MSLKGVTAMRAYKLKYGCVLVIFGYEIRIGHLSRA